MPDPVAALPRALGDPPVRGRYRVEPEDFQVHEQLGFAPSGAGEHVLLRVVKRDLDTERVARALARHAGVRASAVGYAGLKDRRAVAEQWFSVQLPGREAPDWDGLELPGVEVLEQHRHDRKLRRGALAGNRFRLVLRSLEGDPGELQQRWQRILSRGVPNYFGPQRFGRDGANLDRALALFARERRG
ncbi:MAG: tRNA pseudouridine(13) synthase TruD, partial [Candidatus Competibacterales bacterium]|nr:tRNA pseudouridine(13) synthase TruD [Candidatus Competibacterales bacterium]